MANKYLDLTGVGELWKLIKAADDKVKTAITEELAKMAEMYKMEVEKLKEYMGDSEKEQMRADMAVQEAVTLLVESSVEE